MSGKVIRAGLACIPLHCGGAWGRFTGPASRAHRNARAAGRFVEQLHRERALRLSQQEPPRQLQHQHGRARGVVHGPNYACASKGFFAFKHSLARTPRGSHGGSARWCSGSQATCSLGRIDSPGGHQPGTRSNSLVAGAGLACSKPKRQPRVVRQIEIRCISNSSRNS
jgi:hypothetical protein